MFSGLVSGKARIQRLEQEGKTIVLTVKTFPENLAGVKIGDSIAVNGCCLTVVEFDASSFAIDASNETLALTTLGRLAIGAPVNLERAMLPTDRLGGHLVSGHVDGLAIAARRWDDARAERWRFEAPMALLRYVAHKGSVCVDGVSLTVNEVDDAGFEVALIPHTVGHTSFHALREGDAVNIEVDLLARYVERLLDTR